MPPLCTTLEVASDETVFLQGTKANLSAGLEWETPHCAFLRCHSISQWSGAYKTQCDSFTEQTSKENIHGWLDHDCDRSCIARHVGRGLHTLMAVPSGCFSWSQNKRILTVATWHEQSEREQGKSTSVSSAGTSNKASPFDADVCSRYLALDLLEKLLPGWNTARGIRHYLLLCLINTIVKANEPDKSTWHAVKTVAWQLFFFFKCCWFAVFLNCCTITMTQNCLFFF